MGATKATIQVEGHRVTCDRCGVTLGESADSVDRAEDAARMADSWALAPCLPSTRRAGTAVKSPPPMWLCNPCGLAVRELVVSAAAAVVRSRS